MTLGKVCEHGNLKRSCLVCEIAEERDRWRTLAGKLAEALKKIKAYGRPLEAPRASYAVCEINDLATEALALYAAMEKGETK